MLSSFFKRKKKTIVYWCIFIAYTLINGLIECISSIIESSFFIVFTSNKFTLGSVNSKVFLV